MFAVSGSFGCVWLIGRADCTAMNMPQDRRSIWTKLPKVLEQGPEASELRRLILGEPGCGETAAGTILRLRRRLGPLATCAAEAEPAGA